VRSLVTGVPVVSKSSTRLLEKLAASFVNGEGVQKGGEGLNERELGRRQKGSCYEKALRHTLESINQGSNPSWQERFVDGILLEVEATTSSLLGVP